MYFEGTVAQLVEQRTENPCVGGSIPSGATLYNGMFNNVKHMTLRYKYYGQTTY